MDGGNVSALSTNGALQAAALQQAQAQQTTTVQALDAAMSLQESVLKMLLESLGVGAQLDATG